MSDTAFDKTQFQQELCNNLVPLLAGDGAVNAGQLSGFLEYFLGEHAGEYDREKIMAALQNEGFSRAMKLVMIYSTMALTVHEPAVYNAAIEVFPLNEIPVEWATFIIAVLDHIRDHPADETRTFFLQGLAEGQLSNRIEQLRTMLSARFAETL